MDVVYLVRRGEGNIPLQYSLRSLQNIPHDKVWIAGYKPRWVRGVRHIPYRQALGGPLQASHNTTGALYHACGHDQISPDFILMNDDFFIMKPLDEIPLFHRGPMENHYPKWGGHYKEGAVKTKALLRYLGFNFAFSYEMHTPMIINRKKMIEVLDVARLHGATNFRLHKRTLYATYWGLKGEFSKDVKVKDKNQAFSRDSTFLSSAPTTWHHDLGEFVRSKFPHRSPYEP